MAQKKTVKKAVPQKTKEPDALELPESLYQRARKAGMSDDQIRNYTDADALKTFLDTISPSTNPDAVPKADVVEPAPERKPEVLPDKMDVHKDKIREEKEIIESMVRKLNIKFDTPALSKIVKTVVYDCQKKQIEKAEYEIVKG